MLWFLTSKIIKVFVCILCGSTEIIQVRVQNLKFELYYQLKYMLNSIMHSIDFEGHTISMSD